VALIYDAAGWLRTASAQGRGANDTISLFRGLCDAVPPPGFMEHGGTEFAPMSFTRDVDVAVGFAAGGGHATVLRARTANAVERGADVAYLSVYPGEQESLYPPLTYLRPIDTPAPVTIVSSNVQIRVIDVTVR
jgi:hypothetical protein